jgi:hypothetical protein
MLVVGRRADVASIRRIEQGGRPSLGEAEARATEQYRYFAADGRQAYVGISFDALRRASGTTMPWAAPHCA